MAMDSPKSHQKELETEVVMAENISASNNSSSMEWDALDEKRIRQRMDWRIVPTVFALYLLCFIDRWAKI
jgi:hypothetical protein